MGLGGSQSALQQIQCVREPEKRDKERWRCKACNTGGQAVAMEQRACREAVARRCSLPDVLTKG